MCAENRLPKGWTRETIIGLGKHSPGTVQTGPFGAQLHSKDYVNDGVPFILIKNLREGEIDTSDMPHITHKDAHRLSLYSLQPGDIVFSRVGRVGSCFLVEQAQAGWVISGQMLRIRLSTDSIDHRYLIHALRSKPAQDQIKGASVGTTRQSINTHILESLSVVVPPLPEQRRIAEILDTADEAIRQTERVIAKLKAVKAALMHDLLTRGLDEHGRLRDPVAHPEQFKDSPLGRIPAEWEIHDLASVAELDRGRFGHRPRNDPAFYGGRHPFIQTGDVTNSQGGILETHSQTLNERGAGVSREFPVGTIAITIAANIADTAILGQATYFPDSIVGAVVNVPHNNRFVELCIRRAKLWLDAQAPQSAQKNINLEILRPLSVPVPSAEEQQRIAAAYDTLDVRIRAEEVTLHKLRQVKRGLMDDLLTGRVRVGGDWPKTDE